MDLLNLGCGGRFHPAWVNVDLNSSYPAVVAHDIRRPLPFAADSFDGVYHSHVLEHLTPADGQSLLAECHRVLRPGGTIRVAVPDLEGIARNYLAALERAAKGDETATADHEWMIIELLDQMVRSESGGLMKRWLCDPGMPNPSFVERRVGSEMASMALPAGPRAAGLVKRSFRFLLARLQRMFGQVRRGLSRTAVAMLEGPEASAAYRESAFRRSGEVHRWMYDWLSLRRLLEQTGFVEVAVVTALESRITGFASYELDAASGATRKPDSLFIEAVKAASRAA